MKIEEARMKFIALYFAQRVWFDGIHSELFPVYLINEQNATQGHLVLRPIYDLRIEEQLVVAKLFDLDHQQIDDTDLQEWIEALFTESAGFYIDGYTGTQLLAAIDYLRSIGVLLPFTFLQNGNRSVTLPVDQIIKLRWARIRVIPKTVKK